LTFAKKFISHVREIYETDEFIPLHEPKFIGNEKKYVTDTIDSTFVSTAGKYVEAFEQNIAEYVGAKHAIATVNGTSALHMALVLAGVTNGDLVITQSFTFVATCNAVRYCGADPVFVDIDKLGLGMSPHALEEYLTSQTIMKDGQCIHVESGRRIKACVPMHTFGNPVDMDKIISICKRFSVFIVEDAAESLGSMYKGHHTCTFGELGILSFNGNKIITTGGGGMIITNNDELAVKAKYLTTTAKIAHKWNYVHDIVGYNYRMPNLNAALGCAQIENLALFVDKKRQLADKYSSWSRENGINFFQESEMSKSNYWLNAIILDDEKERDAFLKETNDNGVMTRPSWEPMHRLSMYKECFCGSLNNTELMAARIVNIPSSVI